MTLYRDENTLLAFRRHSALGRYSAVIITIRVATIVSMIIISDVWVVMCAVRNGLSRRAAAIL